MKAGFEYFPAPAKLNLFLHVTGRRPDGYHLLQTVFRLLDYGDEVGFRIRQDGEIRRTGRIRGIADDHDLTLRAAHLLRSVSGSRMGADIDLIKRLPVGGGLGGGSSDAATALVALNELWEAGLSVEELAQLGLKIGADVPVFVHGWSAWAEGVGEKLTPVQVPEDWFLVVHPGCDVSTARIFNDPDLTRNTPPITIRDFLAGAGHNDCEPVVFSAYPEVARASAWLGQWSPPRMTGTGSCLYARFGTREAAMEILAQLPQPWQGFVARGKCRSPLLDRLEQERRE